MALYREYLDVQGDFLNYEDFYKNFRIKKPEGFNFAFDVVDRLGRDEPDRLALLWCNTAGDEKRVTFGEMSRLSSKAANMLRAQGVKRGDRVLLILKRHHEFWPVLMGLHKLGAIGVPATHLLTKKDVVYRVQHAHITAVVCTSEGGVAGHVEEALPEIPQLAVRIIIRKPRGNWQSYETLMEAASDVYTPDGRIPGGDDPLLLYFTSGTTGMPKMVVHNHWYPLAHIITAVYWQQDIDGGLHLTISETGWAKSVWGKLYGQWLAGSAVFAYDFDRFVPAEILEMIGRYQITTFCAPPTMYRFLLQEDFSKYDFSSLKHCSVAGEPLSPDMYEEFLKRTGLQMREAFGQTEMVVLLATFPWIKPNPGSMGKPSPLFDVDLINDDGESCQPGVPGEIVIRTHHGAPAGMFVGYDNDEDMTRSVWADGVYHTGDLAWKDEWGYYWYISRKDDVIKSSGYRIGPFEVESALAEHPAVLESAITGAPDPLRGQVVKATVRLKPGYTPSDALKKELQEHVKSVTAPYKYPRIIEFVDELPKTISGKIRRVALRENGG
ncbi:MAG: AMP-binding protein [Oscillospiraceae bacterium]|jgi:acetyl-CoA synthetase|nr:AMP-binding protein [Oscillospiraceae bacterium]